jgi:hypothetical protein
LEIFMKRFVLLCIAAGVCLAACGNGSDSARDDDRPAATGAQRIDKAISPLPADSLNAKPVDAQSDVTGAYFADSLPSAFAEIDFLGLATIDENAKPAPLNGFLRPKKQSAKDYHLTDPKLKGNDLTFSTESIGGVSYSFAGSFTKLGDFPADPPQGVVLKGTLKKMKDGAAIAEAPVSFTYSAGG